MQNKLKCQDQSTTGSHQKNPESHFDFLCDQVHELMESIKERDAIIKALKEERDGVKRPSITRPDYLKVVHSA